MRISQPRSATYVDIHVGERLKVLRKSKGLSQSNVGDGLGVAFQQVQKYERGTNRISVSRLWQICELFDVKPDFFFRGIYNAENKSDGKEKQSSQSLAF